MTGPSTVRPGTRGTLPRGPISRGPVPRGPLSSGPVSSGPLSGGTETLAAEGVENVSVDDLRGQFLHHGRYRLLDLLGVGGPSEVWLAHDTHLDRQVAIKTLRADAGGTWAELTAHEARTLAQIDHPHVVPIYDSFAERDKPWIVMKFIRGRTLADILDSDGPLPEDKLWDVARALSSALAASHRVGIVHRDLKPANVMIGPDNTIWLVDFGIALDGGTQHRTARDGVGTVPAPPKAVGTLAYMAPEALSGKPGRPADLWSLGVLLVTLATGINPFQRPDPLATAGAILHADVPDLPASSLRSVVQQMLQRNPARRPTAEELAARLRAGVPDRVAPEPGRLFRWPRHPRSTAPVPDPAGGLGPPLPATRADSQLAPEQVIAAPPTPQQVPVQPVAPQPMAYWGMSRIINSPPAPPRLATARAVPRDRAPEPAEQRARPRRSPLQAARHAAAVARPVLGGWARQTAAAFAGYWLGLLCLVPLDRAVPQWPWLVGCVLAAVAAGCLSAAAPHASSGRWLAITLGWAVLLSVGTTAALPAGPWAAGAVALVTLGVAALVARAHADPAAMMVRRADGVGARAPTPSAVQSAVTLFAAASAVAVGPAAANGILLLSDRPAARVPLLLVSWVVAVVGVAAVLARGGRAEAADSRPVDAGLRDLLVTVGGVIAGFATTAVLAGGLTLWTGAFGRISRWSDATRWWAYGLAAVVLVVALAGQLRLGRAVRAAAARTSRQTPNGGTTTDRSLGHLGALMIGSLAVAGAGAGVAAALLLWTGQLVVPALLFVVPAAAGGYVVTLAAAGRLTAEPPRRVGHRNPARYGWLAGWTTLLAVVLGLSPTVLGAVLPHLARAELAVGAALCTIVGGVSGQFPVERACRWARQQTAASLGRHGLRLAAHLLAVAAGIAGAAAGLRAVDQVEPTPPGVALAVVVGALGIVVVDLARAGTAASCAFLLVGVAGAMVGGCWLQGALTQRWDGGWPVTEVAVLVTGLVAVGVAAVYLIRFAAELTRNTRGERSNHAFSALLLAAAAGGVVYGLVALAT